MKRYAVMAFCKYNNDDSCYEATLKGLNTTSTCKTIEDVASCQDPKYSSCEKKCLDYNISLECG